MDVSPTFQLCVCQFYFYSNKAESGNRLTLRCAQVQGTLVVVHSDLQNC